MSDKLSAEDLLALFGMGEERNQSVALADSQENLALAAYLVGRSRYSG
jgi:hypothetical protein